MNVQIHNTEYIWNNLTRCFFYYYYCDWNGNLNARLSWAKTNVD